MEETKEFTTTKAVTVVLVLIFLIITTLIVPAKWVSRGGDTALLKRTPLILMSQEELARLKEDTNVNNNPDWRDLLNEETSEALKVSASKITVSEATKQRLANQNNLTASFSKNMYTLSAQAQKNGGLSEEDQKSVVKEVVEAEAQKIIIKEYTSDDIAPTKIDTLSVKKSYGNALGDLLKEAVSYNLLSGDIEILETYTKSKDASLLTSLVVKKNNIDHLISSLLMTKVPFSAIPYHLIVLNRLSAYSTTLDNLSQAQTDPIRATIAFNEYLTTAEGLGTSLAHIQGYFAYWKIVFNQNESGYFLTKGYTK